MREEINAIGHLFGNGFVRFAVTGTKTLVVAVGTSAASLAAIAVGTCEAGIDGYLLHFEWESCRKEFAKISLYGLSFENISGSLLAKIRKNIFVDIVQGND